MYKTPSNASELPMVHSQTDSAKTLVSTLPSNNQPFKICMDASVVKQEESQRATYRIS